jgi:hypothetical protein
MRKRPATLVLVVGAASCLTAGCGAGASYAVRMSYLEKMASEGVQTHRLIASQGGSTTVARCTAAYGGLEDQNPPSDQGDGEGPSQDWLNQIQAFFVQSCATGLPKIVPGQSAGQSPTATPSKSSTGRTPTATPSPTH